MIESDLTTQAENAAPTISRATGLGVPTQWIVLAAIVVALGSAFGFELLGARTVPASAAPAQASQTPAVPGRFYPTPQQLTGFDPQPVKQFTFRSERVTDGKIALNADRTTPVYSPYSGRVTKVVAAPGDVVAAGDPLFVVEASEYVQGENDLVTAAVALDTARSQVTQAETVERRKHALFDAQAGALQDWQQSQSDLVVARNAVRAVEAQVALARNRLRILGRSAGEIDAIQTGRRVRSQATVTAPIGGTVTDRQVGLGQYIQTGATTPQFTIGDLTTVWLVANVREADAASVRRGAPVEVRVLALPDKVFKARIAYVAASVDPQTHRLAVRAEIDNRDGALKPEMFASFHIATAAAAAAPAVPENAVVYEGDSARVWLLERDGSLALRSIQTGRNSDGMVEVRQGLALGDKVATRGTLFIDRAAGGS